MLEDVEQIGDACVRYYKNLYDTQELPNVSFNEGEGIMPIQVIEPEVIEFLQSDASVNEIKKGTSQYIE